MFVALRAAISLLYAPNEHSSNASIALALPSRASSISA
jgi:hypothetical protein